MRVTWAGVRGAGGLRRAQIQGVRTKVHHRCATAAFAGFLLGSQQSKEKRVEKVFHQPAKKSLVDYESSEARIIPARQQEENPETEKRKKSFWHFGSLTKSSSGAQLYACPFQSADFRSSLRGFLFFFLSAPGSQRVPESQTGWLFCSVVSRELSSALLVSLPAWQWSAEERRALCCSPVSYCSFISSPHSTAEREGGRREGGRLLQGLEHVVSRT